MLGNCGNQQTRSPSSWSMGTIGFTGLYVQSCVFNIPLLVISGTHIWTKFFCLVNPLSLSFILRQLWGADASLERDHVNLLVLLCCVRNNAEILLKSTLLQQNISKK